MSTETTTPTGSSFENQIDLEKLHLNPQWSDVKFLFKSGNGTAFESIPANKAVLAAQSDVFAAMFFGELKEKGDITVTDASIGGFKEFLQFFHLNRVKLTVENVADVVDLGHKYNVTKCVDTCAEFLKGNISAESACVGLSLAILYDHEDLMKSCKRYISDHTEAVLKSKSFRECDKPVLACILKMDSLICSETIIFEACMAWIKVKSKRNKVTKKLIQEYLGELFFDFRFTSMEVDEFHTLNTAHDYAFSIAEYKDITDTFGSPMETSKLFNKHPRQGLRNEGTFINCDRKMTESIMHQRHFKHIKPTRFELNQPLLLSTLIFAPISVQRDFKYVDSNSDFPIDVTIIESSNRIKSTRTILNFKIRLPSRKETSIKLPTQVRVQPGFNYRIQLNPLECIDEHHYHCKSLKTEVRIGSDLIIKFRGDRIFKINFPNLASMNIITGLGFDRI